MKNNSVLTEKTMYFIAIYKVMVGSILDKKRDDLFMTTYSLRVFHISVSWWFYNGVWVTASLLKSPGLVSGFWPSSAMLLFGESPTVHQLPSPPGPFNNPLVTVPNAPITIGTIVTFMFHSFFYFSSKVEVLILFFTFLQIYSVVRRDTKVDNFADSRFFFCCWLLLLLLL